MKRLFYISPKLKRLQIYTERGFEGSTGINIDIDGWQNGGTDQGGTAE